MPAGDKIAVQVDGRDLTLTNLAKVLYPADGFTKAEVLDYYQRISAVLLPHVVGPPDDAQALPRRRGRPVVLRQARARRAAGLGAHGRDRVAELPVAFAGRADRVRGDRRPAVADVGGQPRRPRAARPDVALPRPRQRTGSEPAPEHGLEPDLLVFDLDPGAPATVVDCCRVAEALRPVLADADLDALPKTSGGKGLQLYARIRRHERRAGERAGEGLRGAAGTRTPRLVVSRMTKSLRPGKVLIDWSQNNGSKTTVAPYSLRAREHPTVSTPVTWDEVGRLPRRVGPVLHRPRRPRPRRGARRPLRAAAHTR